MMERVSSLFHFGNQYGANRCSVRGGGTGDASKEHAADDIDHAKTTRESADQQQA